MIGGVLILLPIYLTFLLLAKTLAGLWGQGTGELIAAMRRGA